MKHASFPSVFISVIRAEDNPVRISDQIQICVPRVLMKMQPIRFLAHGAKDEVGMPFGYKAVFNLGALQESLSEETA